MIVRNKRVFLLASIALFSTSVYAGTFTVNSATTVPNGGAANIIDGDDIFTVTSSGSIILPVAVTVHAITATGANNVITNEGIIETSGTNSDGISAQNNNTITNSGTIKTSGIMSDGIIAYDGNNITNNGTVKTSGDLTAGLVARDNNTVTNNGTIEASGADSASGIAIFANNNVTNNGTVKTSGNGVFSSGILTLSNGNTITNNGTIKTSGDSASGIIATNDNIITNNGTIETSGNSADGIFVNGNNIISNNGNIITNDDGIVLSQNDNIATNNGIITADDNGINAGYNNTITNNGTITAGDDGIYAWGRNTITNSGIIKATGNNSGAIYLRDWGNRITNSGEIYALGSNGNAFEAEAGGIDTFFTNSGKVVSVEGNSFIFAGSDSQLNLLAPSFIGGAIDMGPGGNAVNITTGRSHSVLWAFPNVTPSIDNSSGVNGAWNAATNQFATIDPTALSASVDVSADMVAGASEIVRNNSTGGEFWLKAFGSYAEYGANGIYNDFNGVNAGIIGGASAQINKDFYAGAMLGYAISNLTVNSRWQTSQTINSGGVIGGFYAKSDIDNFYADFAIFGGFMNNDSSRLVNDNLALMGVDYANANYNSWFISPELRIGVEMASDGEWTITPSVMARYSYQSIDGYTETGSNANATFGARAVQMIEGNVELAASKPFENGTLTIAGGLDYRQNISAGAINSTLIGQNLTIPVNNSATIITYVSANASFDMGDNMLFELNGRIGLGTNGYKAISGTIGVSGKF